MHFRIMPAFTTCGDAQSQRNIRGIFMTQEETTETQLPLNAEHLAAAERAHWRPKSYFERAQMSDIFDRPAPVEADIGCGEGAFIIALAQRHPERNFLGTERLLGRVEKVCRRAAHEHLTNVRVLRLESSWTLQHLLPKECISIAHVGFPDPWPKRHHQRRRMIQDEFMQVVRGALAPGGELRIKTDDLPYFQWIEKVIANATGFERIEWPFDPTYPITNFERRFLERGMPIYSARLRKV